MFARKTFPVVTLGFLASIPSTLYFRTDAIAQLHDQIPAELGKGVLLYDKEPGIRDECIQIQASDITRREVRSTRYELMLVKNKESLMDKIVSSQSAQGSYSLFSGSGKSKFVREIDWNQNSNYILVRAIRVSHQFTLAPRHTHLTPHAQNQLRDSRLGFLESCGNSFISGVEMGGEIFGLIEIQSSTYAEKQQIENSLQAEGAFQVGGATGETQFSRALKKLSSRFRSKVNLHRIGGEETDIPTSIPELLELSRKVEQQMDARPVAIHFTTRDFSTVGSFILHSNDPEITVRQNLMDWAQRKLNSARALYAKIHYILENPHDFKRFDEEALQAKLNELDETIISLKNTIARSTSFLNPIHLDELKIELDIPLPEMTWRASRRPLKTQCEARQSPICGVARYLESRSAACGIESVLEGTGPSCGVLYKQAESPACGPRTWRLKRSESCGIERYKKCYSGSQTGIFGPRKKKRHPSCGVELYKECRIEAHGVETYNSCRHRSHGIERYETCRHKDFGYEFSSCQHFSHGPAEYKTCEVSVIGNQEAACPKF